VLTVLAALHGVHQHLIGRGRQQQAAPWMTGLPSRFLATALAQALRLTMKAIGGWRQMAVMAIFLQALLQGMHLVRKLGHLLLQLLDHVLLLLDHRLLRLKLLLLHTYSFLQGLLEPRTLLRRSWDSPGMLILS
jgi:hypothetical protein